MLLQLCQSAKTHVTEIIANAASESNAKDNINDDTEEKCLTILEIDHMRNKPGYFKIISKWADQLSLTLLVIHLQFKKRKRFLILMWGSDDDIKIFLKNLKSQAVDVDSTGKRCKERLVSVLCSLSEIDIGVCSLSKGVTFEEIESEPQLKTLLNRYKLSQVYDEYVDC